MRARKLIKTAVAELKASEAIDHWQKGRERIEAEDLLAFVMGGDEPDPDDRIGNAERDAFEGLIARRATGEPLPYIKGGVSDPDGVDIEFSSLPSMVTLGPKSRFTPTTLVVTKEQAASLREGKLTSYILGEIIYDDVFDAPHHAIFCYVLLGGTGNSGNIGLYGTHLVSVFQTNELSFRLCRRNNCTDKECGKIPRDKPSTENPSIGDRK